MSNEKHTPGPWELTTIPFELRNTDSAAAIYGPYTLNQGACLISDISRSPGDEQATANAKLIAAAPELLEALNLVFEHAKLIINDNHPDYKKTIAAIKKATE